MPVTHKEFVEFFEEKKRGIYLCPVCANHHFVINVGEPPASGNEEDAVLSEFQLGGGHSFYALSCSNCGATTFIHRGQFDRWRVDKLTAAGRK
jgi:predicted nucleic-acid-binding Zn-ribbon protein